jgi:hypothetical protein
MKVLDWILVIATWTFVFSLGYEVGRVVFG